MSIDGRGKLAGFSGDLSEMIVMALDDVDPSRAYLKLRI